MPIKEGDRVKWKFADYGIEKGMTPKAEEVCRRWSTEGGTVVEVEDGLADVKLFDGHNHMILPVEELVLAVDH